MTGIYIKKKYNPIVLKMEFRFDGLIKVLMPYTNIVKPNVVTIILIAIPINMIMLFIVWYKNTW